MCCPCKELNQKVTAIYGKMTLQERETAKRKAMRTLNRVQGTYEKLKTTLDNPHSFTTHKQSLHTETNSDEEHDQLMNEVNKHDDNEDDESLTIKKLLRLWKTCLTLVQQLVSEELGLVFQNVRQFLIEFNNNQATIQNTLDSLYVQEEIPQRLAICQKRFKRLQETIDRKSRLTYKAKANLEKEMVGLQGFENHPDVRPFLEEVSQVFLRIETEFPAQLAEEESKKEQKLQKLAHLQMTTHREIQLLNHKLDVCIRQAKAQTEEIIKNQI